MSTATCRTREPTLWPRGMSIQTAAAYVGLSQSTVARLVKQGDFPAAVAVTQGRLLWLREDVDDWLDRKAGRTKMDNGGWS